MAPSVLFFLLAIVIVEIVIGLTLNTWIVVFSVKNIKNRSNQVHLTMGLVKFLIQCVMTTQATLWAFEPQIVLMKEIYLPIDFINLFLICCTYWLTSWLSAFYCLSIANYNHQLYVWLKRRLSAFLPHLLLLTIGGSLIVSIPAFWVISLDSEERSFKNATLGAAQGSQTFQFNFLYLIFYLFLGCCLPIGVTLLSIILTIGSLLQHIQNMRQNNIDFDRSKFRLYFNAIKTMAIHLILSLSFYVAEMLCFTSDTITINAKTSIGFLCLLSYPTAQSVIIFQSNSKLRSVFVNIFCPNSARITEPISK
uniref:Taste receptor type 2 n=1 Tax=Pyxicephalus adspersus TaxID=30357 RepID=A0AAV2ZX02_PYXAD|nr:TPA: hypothetical protein GDO54_014830 [Pyxicephalus adspersus]